MFNEFMYRVGWFIVFMTGVATAYSVVDKL